jgi:hypothetical protein
MVVKDSCILVYTSNRIGRPNSDCATTSTQKGGLQKNNRKFKKNGCSKVDRGNTCKVSLFRG